MTGTARSLALALIVAALATSSVAHAAPAPRPGGSCTIPGVHAKARGTEYVCVSKGKTKTWKPVRSGGSQGPTSASALPGLSALVSKRTEVLPIDISNAASIAPFLGSRSHMPHRGIHVNFTGTGPFAAAMEPSAYPAVRAVADGVVGAVEPLREMGAHQAYSINLVIGQEGREEITLNYSLEPFVRQPSPQFYSSFIKVSSGQKVKKGDVIAYLYVPPGQASGTHLHFHMNVGQSMGAPTIFTPDAVSRLQQKFGDPGGMLNGARLPACIGYMVSAAENPLGTGAVDCLN